MHIKFLNFNVILNIDVTIKIERGRMYDVNLTEKQVVVLKSLLVNELEDLKDEIVTAELEQDKKALQEELEACKELLEQLNK